MPANFPSNPNTGDTYSYGGSLWTFDGNGWKISSTTTIPIPSQTSNVGRYLSTDGTNLNWSTVSGGAGSITNVAGVSSGNVSNVQLTAAINQTGIFTTANITELTNLYFTNARAYANVTQIGYITTSALSGYATNAQLSDYATTGSLTAAYNQANTATTNSSSAFDKANTATTIASAAFDSSNTKVTTVGGVTSTTISNTQLASAVSTAGIPSSTLNTDVALGSQTSGAYVANLVAGTGVTLSGLGNEGTTPTISIGQAVGTNNNVTFANVTITGNLNVQGNAVYFDSNTLTINDPLIQVGVNNNSGDAVDLGFFGHYFGGSPSTERHAGLFRDATDGQFKLFTNLDPTPDTIVDTANASYQSANLVVNFVVGKVSDISNHSTTSLSEGSNQYFTNARAYANVTQIGYATIAQVAAKANIVDLTTSNVTEGTNQYFTNARVYANVVQIGYATIAQVSAKANIVDLTTSNVTEGTNQYFTNARVWANIHLANIAVLNDVSSNVPLAGQALIWDSNVFLWAPGNVSAGGGGAGTITSVAGITTGDVSNAQLASGVTTAGIPSSALNTDVALGSQTSGAYVANIVAGTGVILTGLGNEGTTPTIAIGQNVSSTANVVFSNVQVTGNVTTVSLRETSIALTANAAGNTFDLARGNFFTRTISSATTFTFSNVPGSGTAVSVILQITNGGVATINWPTGTRWPGNTAPTLSSANTDVISFFTTNGGTNWNAFLVGRNMS